MFHKVRSPPHLLLLAGLLVACSSSAPADNSDASVADGPAGSGGQGGSGQRDAVPADAPADARPADLAPDHSSSDAVTACGGVTCDADFVCVATTTRSGVPGGGSYTTYACRPKPAACTGPADCGCARSLCGSFVCTCQMQSPTPGTLQCECAAP